MPNGQPSQSDLEAALQAQAAQQQAGNAAPKKKKGFGLDDIIKAPYKAAAAVGSKISAAVDYGDSFLSSFLRHGIRNYVIATGIYTTLANPIIGLPYTLIGAPVAKYAANTVYNTFRGIVRWITFPILHPKQTYEKVKAQGINPFGWLNNLVAAPFKAIKEIATTERQNKLGRTLGNVVGLSAGALAMNVDLLKNWAGEFTEIYHSLTHKASEALTYNKAFTGHYIPALKFS